MKLLGIVIGVALAAAVVIGLVADDLHQRHEVDRARAKTVAVARTVTSLTGQLAGLQGQLAGVQASLAQNQKDLDAARATVAQQGSQLVQLKSCLAGVSSFFDLVAAGNQQGAVNAINAVQPQCDAATQLIGH